MSLCGFAPSLSLRDQVRSHVIFGRNYLLCKVDWILVRLVPAPFDVRVLFSCHYFAVS